MAGFQVDITGTDTPDEEGAPKTPVKRRGRILLRVAAVAAVVPVVEAVPGVVREMAVVVVTPPGFDGTRPCRFLQNCCHVGRTASLLSFPFEGTRSTVDRMVATSIGARS